MPLKITSPEKQTAVLNRWADYIEGLIRDTHQVASRAQSIATAAAQAPVVPNVNVKTVVSNYTITTTDQIILVNSAGSVTIFLSALGHANQVWRFKNIGTGTVTLQPASGLQKLDGASTQILPLQYQSYDVVFDGSNWWTLDRSANFVQVQVDFGFQSAQEGDLARATVTGQPWVTSGSRFTCSAAGTTTADHDPEDAAIEGITAYVENIVPFVGFDVIAKACGDSGTTWGKYLINVTGA